MRHRPLPVDRSNLHPHQHTHTHTHQLYIHYIGSTHTHTPTVLRETSFRAFSLYTPQLRNTTPRRRIPRNSACTYTRMRVSVRAHACCTGKRRPGLFLCVFQVESPDVVHIPCHTPPAPCAFHVENSFSDPILEPGVLHISTHTPLCLDAVKCVSPPLSSPPACMPFCCSTCSIVTVLWSSVLPSSLASCSGGAFCESG